MGSSCGGGGVLLVLVVLVWCCNNIVVFALVCDRKADKFDNCLAITMNERRKEGKKCIHLLETACLAPNHIKETQKPANIM